MRDLFDGELEGLVELLRIAAGDGFAQLGAEVFGEDRIADDGDESRGSAVGVQGEEHLANGAAGRAVGVGGDEELHEVATKGLELELASDFSSGDLMLRLLAGIQTGNGKAAHGQP